MKFYICVYRQPLLTKKVWGKASKNAASDDVLKEYLKRYKNRFKKNRWGKGRFYDWGDDPAFFSAEHLLNDVNRATWGVCRPDVRRNLTKGDALVFFCAQQQKNRKQWRYYYVGIGTVAEVVKGHKRICHEESYMAYQKFYNLLVDKEDKNREKIGYHTEWKKLSKGNYIMFDDDPEKTHFGRR